MIKMKPELDENHDLVYVGEDGSRMKREYGATPNGNNFQGSWVLRDAEGNYVRHSRYRHDILS